MIDTETNLFNLYLKIEDIKNDFRNYNLFKFLCKKIKEDNILDIGSGAGFFISLLKKEGKRVYGVEKNKRLIEFSKKLDKDLLIFNLDSKEIDSIKDIKVDVVTMLDVLEHIEDDEIQIEKVYNLLKEGGKFIIVVPAYKFLFGKRDKKYGHFRRYSKKELIEKLSKSGFEIKKIKYWNMLGFFPYFFYEKILRKEFDTSLRDKELTFTKNKLNKLFNLWFKYIENNINLGFGLSIICFMEKKNGKR